MKDIFICYALERDYLDELKSRLDQISLGAEDVGFTTYAHIRDHQNWQFHNEPIRDVLDRSFKAIRASKVVLLDLTSMNFSKRTGLNIEAGYAKALNKKIVAIYLNDDRPNMTTDLADAVISYSDKQEIRIKVRELLRKLEQFSVHPTNEHNV